ncbi:MAG: NlpC/P60 family protein [Syntrophorhabdaceae bacterium]
MSWVDKYIGIPFKCDGRDRTGADCWGLLTVIYKEQLNIDLPSWSGVFKDQSIGCLKQVARAMAVERERWVKVDKPEPFDVILLRTGAYVWHVGCVIDSTRMIHVMSGINSVIESFTGLQWKNRVQEFRHYAR